MHFAVIIALAVIPMLTIGWIATEYYKKSALENTTAHARRIVDNRKETISRFLKSQRDVLLSLIKLFPLQHIGQQENLEKIFTAVSENGIIVDLGVIDAKGRHLAYVGPYKDKLADKNYFETNWFQEVMVNGSYVSDVFTGYRGVPHLIVAATNPLKTCILRATINSEIFNSLLRTAQLGPAADTFIVNVQGQFQTPSLIGTTELNNAERELLSFHDGTQVRTIGDTLYVTSWLKENQWLFIVKLNTNALLQTYYEAKHVNFLVVIITAAFIITVAGLMVRILVNKIEAADRSKEALDNQMSQVEKMALIGRLAASVAHEVNNPMQMIGDQAGWIEELLAEEDPSAIKNLAEYTASIDKIKYHIKRAATVTHRLLGFSRKMEAEKAKVDINVVLEETLSFFYTEAANNNIRIDKRLQPDLPGTMTDASQLQQVFLNIINNALDAMSKDGCLEIATKGDANKIMVDIGDTGPGIKPEHMNKIFDPYFTTKELGKGTGLGLPICYNIMQKLGGGIEVRNRTAGGTIFTVVVPVIKSGDKG